MIFPMCKWYFDINWHKSEKRWADVFQIYPNAVCLNPLQFCPFTSLLAFSVFCLSSSIILNRYFHILVNSMTIWSVLKLPKIARPRPFNILHNSQIGFLPKNRTADDVLTLRTLIDKYVYHQNEKIYACFVDFRKAFDSVWHDGL